MTPLAPLAGRRILVTRPRSQADDLCDKLASLGAVPILFPVIEITPIEDYALLDQAIVQLDKYQWVIFTSVNGVAAFWERLEEAGKDEGALAGIRVAAIGPATAQALERRGLCAEFIPDEYVAEAIVEGLGDIREQWVLLPRADIAREALAIDLKRRGAIVHEFAAYRTSPAAPDPHGFVELQRGVDAITFTSSSTVRNFIELVTGKETRLLTLGENGPLKPVVGQAVIACIGPITAQTAREVGLPVDVMAREYTMDGLVGALAEHFSGPHPYPPSLRRGGQSEGARENRWR